MEEIFGLMGVLAERIIILSFLVTGTNVGELYSGVVSIKQYLKNHNSYYCLHGKYTYSISK